MKVKSWCVWWSNQICRSISCTTAWFAKKMKNSLWANLCKTSTHNIAVNRAGPPLHLHILSNVKAGRNIWSVGDVTHKEKACYTPLAPSIRSVKCYSSFIHSRLNTATHYIKKYNEITLTVKAGTNETLFIRQHRWQYRPSFYHLKAEHPHIHLLKWLLLLCRVLIAIHAQRTRR